MIFRLLEKYSVQNGAQASCWLLGTVDKSCLGRGCGCGCASHSSLVYSPVRAGLVWLCVCVVGGLSCS
jgi:hypothetical protein